MLSLIRMRMSILPMRSDSATTKLPHEYLQVKKTHNTSVLNFHPVGKYDKGVFDPHRLHPPHYSPGCTVLDLEHEEE